MENKTNPTYYAIIPADVRYDKRLKANEKLMYGEITSLTNSKGMCTANNFYFAELYNVDKMTISRWINKLKKFNYINVQLIYKENSKEIQYRNIFLPYRRNSLHPIDEIVKDNIVISKPDLDKVLAPVLINNSEFAKACANDTQWLEVVCMQNKQTPSQIKTYLKNFNSHLVVTSKQCDDLKGYKTHFSNWLRKQNLKVSRKIENPYKNSGLF